MFRCAQLPIVDEAPENAEVLSTWEDSDCTQSPATPADNSWSREKGT